MCTRAYGSRTFFTVAGLPLRSSSSFVGTTTPPATNVKWSGKPCERASSRTVTMRRDYTEYSGLSPEYSGETHMRMDDPALLGSRVDIGGYCEEAFGPVETAV